MDRKQAFDMNPRGVVMGPRGFDNVMDDQPFFRRLPDSNVLTRICANEIRTYEGWGVSSLRYRPLLYTRLKFWTRCNFRPR